MHCMAINDRIYNQVYNNESFLCISYMLFCMVSYLASNGLFYALFTDLLPVL